MTTRQALQVAACALRVTPGEPMIRLIPAGQFDAPQGTFAGAGPWVLTEQAARRVMEQAGLRSADIVIDYEHQTLLVERNGKAAPASGWIDAKGLEWREDGLYGPVTWTGAAAQAIASDEYRYLSPVFTYDADTGEVLNLLHVALTNTPAINQELGAAALAAARMAYNPATTEDNTVDKEKLIALLGLAASATDQDIENAIAALKAASANLAALRQALDVDDQGDPTAAVAALKTQAGNATPDMTKYVPRAVFEEAQGQIAALKEAGADSEMDRLIEEGLADGRIAGQATADWLRTQGLAALKAHLEDAPGIAALKATQTQGKKPDADDKPGELTKEELAVCKAMGIKPEDYKKANAA